MKMRFTALLAVLTLFTVVAPAQEKKSDAPSTEAKRYGTWGIDLEGMDRTAKPGDDFFKYVSGSWAAKTTIPADKTRYGAFDMLRDLSEARVRGIVEKWAADKSLKPASDEAKVGALYRAFMDEAAIEKADAKPIQPLLEGLAKAEKREDIAKFMAKAPVTFGRSFFGAGVSDDAKNPDRHTLYV